MAACVIYFGKDDSHRVQVLLSAGYEVCRCKSALELKSTLRLGFSPGAILVNEEDLQGSIEVISLAREGSPAPLAVFHRNCGIDAMSGFDMVIHTLTSPRIWLPDLEGLIQGRAAQQRVGALASGGGLRKDCVPAVDILSSERVRRQGGAGMGR